MVLDAGQQATKDESILGGKTTFANHCVALARDLENAFACAQQLEKQYFDNAYNAAAANEIADVDLINYRFTETELGDFINMCGQIKNFATAQAVTAADYIATNNKIK